MNIKKIVLLTGMAFSLLLASCSTDANDVEGIPSENHQEKPSTLITPAQAKTAAINFMGGTRQAKGIPNVTEETIEEIQTLADENDNPVMYAINLKENSGFVVMSASTVERPILAYANEGKFDFDTVDEYNGVADWVATKYLKINGLIESGAFPNENIANQWASVGVAIDVGIEDMDGNIIYVPLPQIIDQWDITTTYGHYLTTRWRQRLSNDPNASIIGYNNLVRYNNCESGIAPTGCVAVAMAQIMKFHNWPNNIFTGPAGGIAAMVNEVDASNYYMAQASMIASFMLHIGTNVNMDYSCTLSSAYSSAARNAFVSNYNYTASGVVPLSFNPLVNDLKSSKPVYLDGCRTRIIKTKPIKTGIFRFTIGSTTYGYENCHAWVADGFEEINRTVVYDTGGTYTFPIAEHIHMNWGWGNTGWDGWYHYETWDNINGVDFAQIDYIYSQDMIYNITPN